MRILFVSGANPFGTAISGDMQRSRLLLKALARLGEVDVVTFSGDAVSNLDHVRLVFSKTMDWEVRVTGKVKKWMAAMPFGDVSSIFPVNREQESILDGIIGQGDYDVIVSRYLFRTSACGLLKYWDRLLVDFDDDPQFYFTQQITPSSSLFRKTRLSLSARKVDRLTRELTRRLRGAFFSHEKVAMRYKGIHLPNIPFYNTSCQDADFGKPFRKLLFVGLLDYAPNRDGIDHFLSKVYLPLKEKLPQLEFDIVGYLSKPVVAERWGQFPGVTLCGFVEDVRSKYEESHVVVVPVYECGGTNIKLLEAMQMNRACVTTGEAFAKMNGRFQKKTDLYVADTDLEFVDALYALLTDEQENRKVANSGKSVMEQYYSMDAFCDIVKKAMM